MHTWLKQVLDLGEVEWTDSWKEGNKRYHKLVTRPDYERWVPKIGRKYVKPEDLDFYGGSWSGLLLAELLRHTCCVANVV